MIITDRWPKPVPTSRAFDWTAFFDDYDGSPDAGHQTQGHGATEFEAVCDLYDDWEDHHDHPLCADRPMFEEDL